MCFGKKIIMWGFISNNETVGPPRLSVSGSKVMGTSYFCIWRHLAGKRLWFSLGSEGKAFVPPKAFLFLN